MLNGNKLLIIIDITNGFILLSSNFFVYLDHYYVWKNGGAEYEKAQIYPLDRNCRWF